MRSDARGQHHVPVMLQEAFASPAKGKKSQVHVFDKHNGRAFQTSPENVLKARDFNTFEQDGATLCLEDGMGDIEDRAAPVLRRVIVERSLAGLSVEERAVLSVFAALQRVRGVSTRTTMLDIDQQIRDRLRRDGDDPHVIPQLDGGNEPEQVKLSALMLVRNQLDVFAQAFAAKVMLLIAAAPGATFLLGDTPVTLANHHDAGLNGNLGLEVEGIEIYLPIAPDLTLAFWCPSLVEVLEACVTQSDKSLRNTAAAALLGVGSEAEVLRTMQADLRVRKARVGADLTAIRAETPISSDHDNMAYYNCLQVVHAERYVLSSDGDFSFVQGMLTASDRYRSGLRMELA